MVTTFDSLQPDHAGREFFRPAIRSKPSNGAGLSRKVIVFGEVADARSIWEKRASLLGIPLRLKPSIGAGFSQTAGDLEHAADQSEKTEK